MNSVLIIDDDRELSEVLALTLEGEGYATRVCHDAESAFEALCSESFSAILLDIKLGRDDGLVILPQVKELAPNSPVIMITAHGDVDSAVAALTQGAFGYLRKPFKEGEVRDKIAQSIDQAGLRSKVRTAIAREGAMDGLTDPRDLILSRDPSMERVLRKISVAALVPSSVVVTGESGTGKELIARSLHQCGPRRSGPFVAFNCAALPENLIESELFGYARGAFTDARENKAGLFVRANGGTLFLDEIGDASLAIQAKLLRVLQEREVVPLGGTQAIKLDVRVVSATHKSLRAEVESGRFRSDLYYRMHVLSIHLPPLRERPKDVLLLANVFAEKIAKRMSLPFDGFTTGASVAMQAYAWPGNIRELQNRIEQAVALGRGGKISRDALFPEEESSSPETTSPEAEELPPATGEEELLPFHEAKNSFERNYLERVLEAAKGNIAKAARLASKSRTEVYSLVRKHGLDPMIFKTRGDRGGVDRG